MAIDERTEDLTTELHNLEAQLAALTLEVAALRNRIRTNAPAPGVHIIGDLPIRGRLPTLGDRVTFYIKDQGLAEGVIFAVTAKRFHIRQNVTNNNYLRAYHNVALQF